MFKKIFVGLVVSTLFGSVLYAKSKPKLLFYCGITMVKPIKEIEEKLTYILPDHLIGIIWKGKYKGQKQKWFIMKFISNCMSC